MFKLFKRYLKPYKWKVLVMIVFMVLSAAGSLTLPTVMGLIVNNGINGGNMTLIIKYSAIMFAVAAAVIISQIIYLKIESAVISRFIADMRKDVFESALHLSFDKFGEIGTGGLITRSTEDMWLIEEMFMMVISGVFNVPLLLIGGTVLAFLTDPVLAAIVFAFSPIIVVMIIVVGKRVVKIWDTSEKYMDKQNSLVRDRLLGIRVIRAFNKEEEEHKKISKATEVMATNIIKSNVYSQSLQPVAILLLNIVTVLILYFASVRVKNVNSLIKSGSVMAIIEYVTLVMNGIMTLAFGLIMIPRATINAKRINEVLDAEKTPEATDLDKPPFKGSIEFKDVTFSYADGSEPVLYDLNFKINAGEKVAFIGGTGSGKSTVVSLIMKFFAPDSGDILFDGESIKDISGERIHINCAVALQKASIFSGTLKENILLGKDDATDEEVDYAVESAMLKSFVEEKQEGLGFEVTQGGTNLSGGQKQRLSLARTLIKKSAVYIFDDTFSALDFLTESKIRNRINADLKGKTQLIITQRVASAMSADNIFVLDNGRIVSFGKHEYLLENCPIYKDIYLSQTGGAL